MLVLVAARLLRAARCGPAARRCGARLPEILAYVGLAGGLLLLLSWVGYGYRTTNGATFEQGRYLFPLMCAVGRADRDRADRASAAASAR